MNTTKNAANDRPEDVELLLPWHAAGALSRRDAARVEEALARDRELARRYELVREELGEAIRLNESLGAPSARAMKELFAKIDAEPVRSGKPSFRLGAWLIEFIAGLSPRALAYGAAAAAVVVLLQAGILAGVLLSERGGPQLASHPPVETVGEGVFVLVRFKPEATAAQITRFLQEHGATIVAGPTAGNGLFRLRLAQTPTSPSQPDAIAEQMAKDPAVALVLPAWQP